MITVTTYFQDIMQILVIVFYFDKVYIRKIDNNYLIMVDYVTLL